MAEQDDLDRKFRALQIGYAALTDDERAYMQNDIMEGLLMTADEQRAFDEAIGVHDVLENKTEVQALSEAVSPAMQMSRKDMAQQVRHLASAIRHNFGKLKESAQQTLSPALNRAAVWYRKNLDRAKARYLQGFPYDKPLDEQITWVETQQVASPGAEQGRKLNLMHQYLIHEKHRLDGINTKDEVYEWLADNESDYDEEIAFLYEDSEHVLSAKLELLEEKLYNLPKSSLDEQITYVAKCVYEAEILRQDGAFDEQEHGAMLNNIDRGALDCFTLLETARQDELHEGIVALEKSVQQGPSVSGQNMVWIKEKSGEVGRFVRSRVEPRTEDKQILKTVEEALMKQKTAAMRANVGGSKPAHDAEQTFEPPQKR
jgi:hypothetical protein